MGVDIDKKRVVALCGSGGCGKTTLSEDILFLTKQTTRKGSVENGNTVMDFDTEEINRKNSLQLAVGNTQWHKNLIYFIDTPGYHNFIADTLCGIQAADSSIIVLDAKEGVKAQTERVFEEARKKENKPVLFFVNGIDKEDIEMDKTFASIKELDPKALILHLPIFDKESIKGFVDVLNKKAYDYQNVRIDIPKEMEDAVEEKHLNLVEEISTFDDELMEKYLEGEEIEPEVLHKTLKTAVENAKISPILIGSAAKSFGTKELLDAIIELLPAPKEEYDKNVALVFKTYNDPQIGKISLMRVCSGKFSSDTNYFNVNKEQDERLGALQNVQGKSFSKIENITAGDIVAVAKLKTTETGDTISDKNSDIKCDFVNMPLPFISYAIYGSSKGDEEKIGSAISKIIESDPSLKFTRNPETKEFIVTGMGKMHLEVTASKLKNKFGVDVALKLPKIAYRETIKGKNQSHGRYKKQTGGHGQFGDCVIKIEPKPRGGGFEFVDMIVGGAIPKQFIPSVEKGIKAAMEEGKLAGYPMTDIKITLIDGSYHPVDSSDLAFQMAGSAAFKDGIPHCKPILLEPIMEMEIYVPDENMGDVIGDINSRRGKIAGMEPYKDKKGYQSIKALVPESEILEYAPTLRSITGGRGFFKFKFAMYEEVPQQIAEKIIEKAKE